MAAAGKVGELISAGVIRSTTISVGISAASILTIFLALVIFRRNNKMTVLPSLLCLFLVGLTGHTKEPCQDSHFTICNGVQHFSFSGIDRV
jgi:hypothetical protein